MKNTFLSVIDKSIHKLSDTKDEFDKTFGSRKPETLFERKNSIIGMIEDLTLDTTSDFEKQRLMEELKRRKETINKLSKLREELE